MKSSFTYTLDIPTASSYLSKNIKNTFNEINHIDVNYNHHEYNDKQNF